MTDIVADEMGRTIVRLLRGRSTVASRRQDMQALFGYLKHHADPNETFKEWRKVFVAALGCEHEINGNA